MAPIINLGFRPIVLFLGAALMAASSNNEHVNVFIGTGGVGAGEAALYPGPQVPFGMMRLSPDTSHFEPIYIPAVHFGGYYYYDTHIRRFSHLHMVGPGVADLGNLGVTAVTVPMKAEEIAVPWGFASSFHHTDEVGGPGYYSVLLNTFNDTLVELTATEHVGMHRYSFSKDAEHRTILIDVAHCLANFDPEVTLGEIQFVVKEQKIIGKLHMKGDLSNRYGGFDMFFVASFSEQFDLEGQYGVWSAGHVSPNKTQAVMGEQYGLGAYVSFASETVEVAVGVSLISLEQADANLHAEVLDRNWGFDEVHEHAQQVWSQTLDIVSLVVPRDSDDIGSQDLLQLFYTALYHSFLSPTNYTEPGGRYVGFDKQVHSIPNSKQSTSPPSPSKLPPNPATPSHPWHFQTYYSDMSIWDTHRTQFPLLALLQPQMAKQGGDLPRWPLLIGYTGCMIGAHATVVLAEAVAKGVREFDVDTAYEKARLQALGPRPHGPQGIESYMQFGFVPANTSHSVSLSLALAYDDGALSVMAKTLGHESDADFFRNRSRNYQHLWNGSYKGGFFCARRTDLSWDCPNDIEDWLDDRYIEGNARQWRWFVPHDVPGLVELFGGQQPFAQALFQFINDSQKYPGTVLPNFAYWAGNEPDILAPWLFAYAGRLDLTAEAIRLIMRTQYGTGPSGIPGNDDYGTLSSWAVWAMLGLYPLAGSSEYLLGSPFFSKATLHLPGGDLTITAANLSQQNIYVQQVSVNGELVNLRFPVITHQQIINGGVMDFEMGPHPP